MKLIVLFILASCFFSTYAQEWKESFYTDSSSYYLRLQQNGFKQRFRVNKSHCSQIESAKLIFNRRGNYGADQQFSLPTFYLRDNGYSAVSVAGDFNEWNPSSDLLVYNSRTGYWELTLDLPEGEYAYQFIIDGEWTPDYNAQKMVNDASGWQNSVLVVEDIPEVKSSFRKLKSLSSWPELSALNADDYCWYELQAQGIDLNRPYQNRYKIQINSKNGFAPLYFVGIDRSLVPSKRLLSSNENNNWIDLGALGNSVVEDGGVFFRVWEPTADHVHLFINTGGAFEEEETPYSAMIPNTNLPKVEYKTFSYYDENARTGDDYHYQYWKWYQYDWVFYGNDYVMTPVKIDPLALQMDYDDKGGHLNGYLNARSIITANSSYPWKADKKIRQLREEQFNNWLIYQIWPLTFNPQKKKGDFVGGTFKDILAKRPYLEELGINAVELLPINESRFNATWGYGLDSLLLIEKNYGSTTELKELVDGLHQSGIRVILDVVINHINNSLWRDPLADSEVTKFFGGSNEWGPIPRFERTMVQQHIAASLIALIREYHVDGFRFDMTHSIYKDNSGGYQFLQDLTALLKVVSPDFHTSAEELPDNVWVTKPASEQGAGFDAQWNDRFKNFFEHNLDYYREGSWAVDLFDLKESLQGISNHYNGSGHYYFGSPLRTINYLGSHDFIGNKNPIIRILSDYDGVEEVGGTIFSRVNPLTDSNPQQAFASIHTPFAHAATLLSYGVLFTKPGQVLFFQGEEFGNDINIQNEWSYLLPDESGNPTQDVEIDRFLNSHRMPWEYYTPEKLSFLKEGQRELLRGQFSFFKDLLKFRRQNNELSLQDASDVYLNGKVISYRLKSGNNNYYVVANWGEAQDGFSVQFPSGGYWSELVNSSNTIYGGSNDKLLNIVSYKGGFYQQIRLAANSIAIFKQEGKATISKDLYLRGSFNGWQATSKLARLDNTRFASTVVITKKTDYQFKLGTADWAIELGSNPYQYQHLSYYPGNGNNNVTLGPGKYQFIFNIEDYSYTFRKVN